MDSATQTVVVGGVELLNRLGSGGMGEVHLGRHLATGMQVAVKLLKDGTSAKERFLNEARLGLGLADPHLVRVYNAGETDGRLFIVMELLPGGTVRDRLREGRLHWERATDLLLEAARGLAALHRAGVIHRDIKPSNMMFAGNGTLRLTDFGLARRMVDGGIVTRSSDRLGSPAYTAPEQLFNASEADARSDVYSLGISYYEILTGSPPFRTPSETDVCFQQVHRPLPDIRATVPDLPRKLIDLLQRMTAKDPLQRPADGQVVVDAIEHLRRSGMTTTVRLRRPRRSGALWAALLVAVIALGTVALPGFLSPTRTPASLSWQSPERAVFMLPADLDAATAHAVHAGLTRTDLNVVERAEIGRLLAGPDFAATDLMHAGTAVRIGNLVGGHLAVFARVLDGRLSLRVVEVETSLLRGSELIAPTQAEAGTEQLIRAVMRQLPARGLVESIETSAVDPSPPRCRISLGQRHGIAVGDHFRIHAGTPGYPGAPIANGTVDEVTATSALLRIESGTPVSGTPVERISAP